MTNIMAHIIRAVIRMATFYIAFLVTYWLTHALFLVVLGSMFHFSWETAADDLNAIAYFPLKAVVYGPEALLSHTSWYHAGGMGFWERIMWPIVFVMFVLSLIYFGLFIVVKIFGTVFGGVRSFTDKRR